MNHQEKINQLAAACANYLLDDRERNDYLDSCAENDLNPNDFLKNGKAEGGHIYAVAQALIFHLEQFDTPF